MIRVISRYPQESGFNWSLIYSSIQKRAKREKNNLLETSHEIKLFLLCLCSSHPPPLPPGPYPAPISPYPHLLPQISSFLFVSSHFWAEATRNKPHFLSFLLGTRGNKVFFLFIPKTITADIL